MGLMMETKSTEQRTVNAQEVVLQVFLGFVFGFFLLHPISMVIFRWLDPCFANGMPDVAKDSTLATALHAFDPSMFPMGLAYGFLGSLIAAGSGYYRATIRNQRDALMVQNKQLAALELTNRRNTHFIVHDLRTHAGCILGFSNLLLDHQDPHRAAEDEDSLQRIRRQALVMKDNIGQLLQFARLQETAKIHRQETSAADLLHQAIEVFSPLREGHEIVIGQKVKECPSVWGDQNLLRRVLTNLVANSLKHNRGSVQVLLDADWHAEEEKVLFSCVDNGGGIPVGMMGSIFEEFSSDDHGKQESTGLGLAFCKAAVEAHGGRIWCESDGRIGASFYFAVPVTRKERKDE